MLVGGKGGTKTPSSDVADGSDPLAFGMASKRKQKNRWVIREHPRWGDAVQTRRADLHVACQTGWSRDMPLLVVGEVAGMMVEFAPGDAKRGDDC